MCCAASFLLHCPTEKACSGMCGLGLYILRQVSLGQVFLRGCDVREPVLCCCAQPALPRVLPGGNNVLLRLHWLLG